MGIRIIILQEHHDKEPAVIAFRFWNRNTYKHINGKDHVSKGVIIVCKLHQCIIKPRPYLRVDFSMVTPLNFSCGVFRVQYVNLLISVVDNIYTPMEIIVDRQKNQCRKT